MPLCNPRTDDTPLAVWRLALGPQLAGRNYDEEPLIFDYIITDWKPDGPRMFACILALGGHEPALPSEVGLDADVVKVTYADSCVLASVPPGKIPGLPRLEEREEWAKIPGNAWCWDKFETATVLLA